MFKYRAVFYFIETLPVFKGYCFIKSCGPKSSWWCQWELCIDLAHNRKDDWCKYEYRHIDLLMIVSKNGLTQVQLAETNSRIQKYGHLSPGTFKPATWTNRLYNILMYLASAAASKITIHRLWSETPFTLFMLHAWLSAEKASHIGTTICQGEEPFAQW